MGGLALASTIILTGRNAPTAGFAAETAPAIAHGAV